MNKDRIPQITIAWGFRKQNLKECTETVIVFLERLKRFDSRFNNWHKVNPQKQIILSYDFIKDSFCKNCHDNDFSDFSYDLNLWNGEKTDSLSYDIVISIGGFKVGNNVITFTFPNDGEIYDHYLAKDNWKRLLNLFIDHWNPDKVRNYRGELIDL